MIIVRDFVISVDVVVTTRRDAETLRLALASVRRARELLANALIDHRELAREELALAQGRLEGLLSHTHAEELPDEP